MPSHCTVLAGATVVLREVRRACLLLGRGRQPLEAMRCYLFPSRCLVGRESSFD